MEDISNIVTNILRKFINLDKHKAFIFGSFATSKFGRTSDIDIGIEGEKLPDDVYFNLVSAFEESDLPYVVDVVEFRDVSEDFKKVAKKEIIEIH